MKIQRSAAPAAMLSSTVRSPEHVPRGDKNPTELPAQAGTPLPRGSPRPDACSGGELTRRRFEGPIVGVVRQN